MVRERCMTLFIGMLRIGERYENFSIKIYCYCFVVSIKGLEYKFTRYRRCVLEGV